MNDVWLKLKHFKPTGSNDNWGDPDKLDETLLLKLDDLREFIGAPIHVTSGFRPKSNGSQHQLGRAVDIVAPDFKGGLLDLYLAAERFFFKGIGVYPNWHYQGVQCGGLHLDERELGLDPEKPESFYGARWMGIMDSGGVQRYIALNKENLNRYGVTST